MKRAEEKELDSSRPALAGNSYNDMPALLTQGEAIRLLRLDQLGLKSPKETLRHLRRTRQLGYVKVAGKVLVPRQEIIRYLEKQTVKAVD